MKNKHLIRGLVFSFLLSYVIAFPLQVSAAGANLEKEITITVPSGDEAREEAEKEFPETLKEDGKQYTRVGIEYEDLGINYLDKKEKTLELKEEPKDTYTENGVTYTLEKSEKIEKTVKEEAVQTVSAYDDYDYEVSASAVSATKTVSAVNEVTGETESVVCAFSGIAPAGVSVVDTTMTITFSNYDAAYYEWNGNYIARNDQTPPLAGYESELLAQAGAAAGSVVTGYYWTGDPYTVDGVVYRDAAANVQQQVQMYRANYTGSITTPEQTETVYKTVYSTPDKEGEMEYSVKATAHYVEETSYLPYIAAGAGLLILAGLIAAILVVLSKKKKEQEKQENK